MTAKRFGYLAAMSKRPRIAIAGPGRRHDDGAVDAGGRHFLEHFFRAKSVGPMRRALLWLWPRAIQAFGLPKMDLDIRNQFVAPPRRQERCESIA